MSNIAIIHKNCHQIFDREFIQKAKVSSTACKVYDTLTGGEESKQDCIGENFNQLIHKVLNNWFTCFTPNGEIDFYFYNYILLMYLFVERVDFVFSVINKDGKSKIFNDFHHNNFSTLRKINKWANFIKHPKEFLFTHWPKYYLEGEHIIIGENDVKIDSDFIFKHYFCESNPRPVILENNNKVFVEIPDLEVMTESFCKEMNVFFNFICENKVVADYLKKKSTLETYYTVNDN